MNTKDTPIDDTPETKSELLAKWVSELHEENASLKLELQKQKELNAELVKSVKWLLETLKPFENMEALGPLESFKIREIESLLKKANEI